MKNNSVRVRTIATTRHLIVRRACLRPGFLAFAAMAFAHQPGQAAVIEAWVQRYSNVVSNAADQAVKVVHDPAGDVIVTGTTYGIGPRGSLATIKYSGTNGSILWQQRFGPGTATGLAVDGSGNVVVTGYSYSSENLLELYTAKCAAADGALLWEKRHDSGYATSVAVDGSGNVVITGTSDGEFYTAKYAESDGALLWERRYKGPGGDDDRARAVAVDASGDVVVTGSSSADFDTFGRHNRDYYTAKYAAADGALIWERRYDGPANLDDEAISVMVDGSGNVMVTGYSVRSSGDPDFYTAKYAAADGALLWEKRYNGPANRNDSAWALALDSSGNVVVSGTSHNDWYTAKYAAADGALLWDQRQSGPATSYAHAVAVDGSGNVVVTGESQGNYLTVKYAAADGAMLWEKNHNCSGSGLALARAVAVDGSGNVVVTGFSGAWFLDKYEAGDYCTLKYAAADGALVWEQSYDASAPHSASARSVAVDGSGNVAVTGVAFNRSKNGGFNINADYYTARYAAADGALLWEKRYNSPENGEDEAHAVGVDASGNVVVTGYSARSSGDHDYYTAKYAAANGALLWEKRYNGPEKGGDAASALALDGSGNVVVTGASVGGVDSFGNPTSDYYTAKYAAADGALLWERRYNGPANRDDGATAVTVDGSGNAVVTGYSSSSTNADYYTAKYAAADGALLWEQRYNGPTNGGGSASAIAVDSSGNVLVTGSVYYPLGTSDFHTIKYAAADGAVLWQRRYNGLANGYDQARGVAVDGSGNVVVTGESQRDYYTVKYASADGAVLWQKRFSGSSASDDRPGAVAVDGSGNVFVTGSSSYYGYYTIKYAAADGATLWVKRFSESASGDDSSLCIALGSDGRVVVAGSSNGGYATVAYREVPEAISITLIPTGIRLRFSGAFGRSCNIERALVATGPWTTINTQTPPASGLIEYLDASPPAARAFYRASAP